MDWNEVRVSSVREIQEHLKGAENSLELAVFIKDFLEFVQRERHNLSLEFLAEENLTDVRRFFRQVKGVDASTVDVVLLLRKEHPVFPMSDGMEKMLEKLGLARRQDTRDRKQKSLYKHVEPESTLVLHHFLLDVSRSVCPDGENCPTLPPVPKSNLARYFKQLATTKSKTKTKSKTDSKSKKAAGGAARRTSKTKSSGKAGSSPARKSPAGKGPSRTGKVSGSRSKVIRRAVAAKRVGESR